MGVGIVSGRGVVGGLNEIVRGKYLGGGLVYRRGFIIVSCYYFCGYYYC